MSIHSNPPPAVGYLSSQRSHHTLRLATSIQGLMWERSVRVHASAGQTAPERDHVTGIVSIDAIRQMRRGFASDSWVHVC